METKLVRKKIALDLKGQSSRNPASLIPELSKELGVESEVITNQINQMGDAGHIIPIDKSPGASIRLSELGEQYYFSTREERFWSFFEKNWPHITSNLIALLALLITLFKNFKN